MIRAERTGAKATTPARAKRLVLLIAAIAVAPVILSYFAYYALPRDSRVNYGTLVARPFHDVAGTTLDGKPLSTRDFRGRWTVLFRGLLAFPAGLIGGALQGVMYMAAILGWFASLFTGRMPRGLREIIAWGLRYSAQLMAYGLLLTPAYPYSGPGRCD